jgi:hypothetical protein
MRPEYAQLSLYQPLSLIMVGLSDTDTNQFTMVLKYKTTLNCRATESGLQELALQSQEAPQTIQINEMRKTNDSQERIVNKLHQQQKRLSDDEIAQMVAAYE